MVVVIFIVFIGTGTIPDISAITIKKMYSSVNNSDNKYLNYIQEIAIDGENITALIVGVIFDLKIEENQIKFKCGNRFLPLPIFWCRIFPIPSIEDYQLNGPFWWSEVTISEQKIGIIRPHFICAICTIIPPSTKVTLKVSNHDDKTNTIIWEVTKVEGDPIGEFNLKVKLWSDNCSFYIWDQHQVGDGDLNPGDTITIQVNPSGYYHTLFIDRVSLVTLSDELIVNY